MMGLHHCIRADMKEEANAILGNDLIVRAYGNIPKGNEICLWEDWIKDAQDDMIDVVQANDRLEQQMADEQNMNDGKNEIYNEEMMKEDETIDVDKI
jgi:hypothetical protein